MREWLGLVGLGTVGIPGLGLCRLHVQQAARLSDVVGAGAAGEQAVVADAVEAVRQDVDQESADGPMAAYSGRFAFATIRGTNIARLISSYCCTSATCCRLT